MLEIIDNIAPLISDNNYLQLCNGLKKLNDNKSKETIIQYIEVVRERIRNNPVVQTHQTRTLKVRYKTHSLIMLRMRLSHIFERLLLQEILKMGKSRTGRPKKYDSLKSQIFFVRFRLQQQKKKMISLCTDTRGHVLETF
jgi:hypothetical protein